MTSRERKALERLARAALRFDRERRRGGFLPYGEKCEADRYNYVPLKAAHVKDFLNSLDDYGSGDGRWIPSTSALKELCEVWLEVRAPRPSAEGEDKFDAKP